jgi:hemin uptake protein HemP
MIHGSPSVADRVAASAAREPTVAAPLRRHASRDLVGPANVAIIEHAGEEYRLRVTSNGKLILTK